MPKPIELMWKEGFLKEANLTAPLVNDLYNRKSQNVVDKLQRMFAFNINGVIVGGLIVLVILSLTGAAFLGLYICCLLTPLIILAKKEIKKSTNLDKGQSSYEYLVGFNTWLKGAIKTYSNYFTLFYPLLFLGLATHASASKQGKELIALMLERAPTDFIVLGQPYYVLLCLIVLTGFIAKFSGAFYRWDINIVYGHQFKKLEELIADMEELRK